MTELILQGILVVIASVITTYVTVKLSIKQFYSTRWWEKQAEAYSHIIEHLSYLQYYFGERLDMREVWSPGGFPLGIKMKDLLNTQEFVTFWKVQTLFQEQEHHPAKIQQVKSPILSAEEGVDRFLFLLGDLLFLVLQVTLVLDVGIYQDMFLLSRLLDDFSTHIFSEIPVQILYVLLSTGVEE